MVLAGVVFEESELKYLETTDIKDSKLLSKKKREELFKFITKNCKRYDIQIVSPKAIDDKEKNGLNLNDLEAMKCAEIINVLSPDKAIIDCPSNNIKAWSNTVKKYLTNKCEIIAEHKADLNHKICGAASILAKCTRDNEIAKIQSKIKTPIGSGYPSDPVTKKFIQENHDKYQDIFRKSWATYKKIADQKNQGLLEDY